MIISLAAAALALAAQPVTDAPPAGGSAESMQMRVVQRSDGPGRSRCTTTAEGEAQGVIAANLCRLGASLSESAARPGTVFLVEISGGDRPLPRAAVSGARLLADDEVEVTVDASGAVTDCGRRAGASADICAWLGAGAFEPGEPLRRGRVRVAAFAEDEQLAGR